MREHQHLGRLTTTAIATACVLAGAAGTPTTATAATTDQLDTRASTAAADSRPGTTTPVITRAALTVRRLPAASFGATSRAVGLRCWAGRAHFESTSLAGTTVYSWWQTLRWCSRDGRTISAWRVLDRGGETSTPGWSYAGPGRRGQVVAGGVLRSYTQERFSFSVLWTSYTSTPCAQIRATATGRATVSTACGL